MKLHLAIAFTTFFLSLGCNAFEMKKFKVDTRVQFVDNDVEFTLTRQEVNTLDTDATKATILAALVPLTGPLAPVVSAFVNEHIADVKRKAGYGGAWVKMTIRNAATLHVWEVYGIQEKTTFSTPQVDGLPVDATTWEFGGTNEETYNKLAAHAYCKRQGYTDLDSYTTRELSTAGTTRFLSSGQVKFCDFCRKAFASVRCGR